MCLSAVYCWACTVKRSVPAEISADDKSHSWWEHGSRAPQNNNKKRVYVRLFAPVSSLWVTVACLITAYNILFIQNVGFSTMILLCTQQIKIPSAIRTAIRGSRMISRGEALIYIHWGVTGVVILIQINNPLVAACEDIKLNQNYRINSTPIHP